MFSGVRAVLFDIGETLGIRQPDPGLRVAAVPRMLELLQIDRSPQVFVEEIEARYRAYVRWREESLIELCEQELWTRWLLPDLSPERIRPLAYELTYLWRSRGGKRVLRDDAPMVIRELVRRGYTLGIISNTISSRETPECLKAYGLTDCFSTVLLSCTFGRRKPDPIIFQEAARQARVQPNGCAYVGDRPSRDVAGPRSAGYAMAIIFADSPYEENAADLSLEPDLIIPTLATLLDYLPPLSASQDTRHKSTP